MFYRQTVLAEAPPTNAHAAYNRLLSVQSGKGLALCTCKDAFQTRNLRCGDVLAVPPHGDYVLATADPSEPLIVDVVVFDCRQVSLPDSIRNIFRDVCFFSPSQAIRPQLAHLLASIEKEAYQQDWATPHVLRLLVDQILLLLLRDHRETPAHPPLRTDGDDAATRIAVVLKYIEDHLAENLSVKDLADLVGVSPRHLSSLFRKSTDMTIVSYINLRRVEVAKELLLQTTRSITEIAYEVGFGSLGPFYEAFKRYTGMIPSAYRSSIGAFPQITEEPARRTQIDGWRIAFHGPGLTVKRDPTVTFCSGSSLLVELHRERAGGIYRDITISHRTLYRFRAAYKLAPMTAYHNEDKTGEILVRFQFRGPTNKLVATKLRIAGGQGQTAPNGWKVLAYDFRVPAKASNMRLELLVGQIPSKVWWDDVWLVPLSG